MTEHELRDLLALSRQVENCDDEVQLWQSLDELAQVFGSTDWLYAVFNRNEQEHNYTFVCAVPPRWLQRYVRCAWHEQDRALRHAAQSSDIAQISDLPELATADPKRVPISIDMGIADGIVVPAFSALPSMVGALLLLYPSGMVVPLEKALQGRSVLRAFSLAVLDYVLGEIRSDMLEQLQMNELDRQVLALGIQNMTSKEIARVVGIEEKGVDRIFGRIMRRMKVNRRNHAIRMARDHGLA